MGNSQKKLQITQSECEEFASISRFSPKEIKYILLQFRKISKIYLDDGVIDYDEFLCCIGIPNSLISEQLFNIMDSNGDKKINFREFVTGLNFLVDEDQAMISKIIFKLFDTRNVKNVGIEEIASVIESCLKQFPNVKISKEQIRNIIKQDLSDFAVDVKNKLEEPSLSFSSVRTLNMILENLKNLQSFRFNEETFFIYFKFNPVYFKWFQVDIDLIRKNAMLMANKE